LSKFEADHRSASSEHSRRGCGAERKYSVRLQFVGKLRLAIAPSSCVARYSSANDLGSRQTARSDIRDLLEDARASCVVKDTGDRMSQDARCDRINRQGLKVSLSGQFRFQEPDNVAAFNLPTPRS
jgi:hypothetical protein